LACFDLLDTTVRYSSTGSLAGLIIEPYQGAAGFIFAPDGYLKRVEQWCADNDVVFILDEVQSSFGRTGKMFMLEWEGLQPQLVCVGKGIGSGMPTSALLSTDDVIGALGKGEMSSTCGGNPVASAACLAVLDIMERENLGDNALKIGAIIKQRLLDIQGRCPYLGDVRGMGLVMGMEFVQDKRTKEPAPDITRRVIDTAAQHGVLVGSVGIFGNVIRVAPPLVMSEPEAHESLDIIEHVLTSL
jgi:4-aminobutyrate aminotransferase/(S)-3-amino-2-methylpropionate transaminase